MKERGKKERKSLRNRRKEISSETKKADGFVQYGLKKTEKRRKKQVR